MTKQTCHAGAKRFLALPRGYQELTYYSILGNLVYVYIDGHVQVTDCDIIDCINVVRVVVKQFNWSS